MFKYSENEIAWSSSSNFFLRIYNVIWTTFCFNFWLNQFISDQISYWIFSIYLLFFQVNLKIYETVIIDLHPDWIIEKTDSKTHVSHMTFNLQT